MGSSQRAESCQRLKLLSVVELGPNRRNSEVRIYSVFVRFPQFFVKMRVLLVEKW